MTVTQRISLLVGLLTLLIPASRQTLARGELDKLNASDALAGAGFGRSVALDGATAVVGAYNQGSSGPFVYDGPGAAYVYRPTPGGWIESARLSASDAATGDWFGYSVSVSGNKALIGAIGDDEHGSSSGSAYVFRFDGTNWIEEAKLTASDGAREDRFGFSVSIADDLAVVGAPQNSLTATGRAYVFRFDGTDWNEEARLLAADGGARDDFGISVSIDTDAAVVGAWNHGNTGQSFPDGNGAAYVFRFDSSSGNWSQEAKLVSTAPRPGERDRFGRSVSLRVDALAVGTEPIGFAEPAPKGSAYIFRFDGSNWIGDARLEGSDSEPGDRFGYSVSLGAGVALVGAWGAWSVATPCSENPPFGGLCNAGTAYTFRRQADSSWVEEARLDAGDIAEGDLLGWSVAVSGDIALAGSWRDDDAGPDSGSAYLFSIAPRWTDLGFALAGSCGTPVLSGEGSLVAGASVTLALESTCSNALGIHLIGLSRVDLPFRGGLLVAAPDFLAAFLTDASGGFEITAPAPAGLAPGTDVYLHSWIADPGAPASFAASNAITARVP